MSLSHSGDQLFFDAHHDRKARIRRPLPDEAEEDFRAMGYHDPARRRMLVWRVPPDGPVPGRIIPIPFLIGFDETIEDDDAILLPMLADFMKDAAKELGIEIPRVGRG